ncbi:galactokinase [Actinomycetospora sp. OC33-EN08]|uniref:Galactokinase n=1 Tax=Actinomycetospora aurantiaca TaxID=3129233 RepID=A0ABU8MPM8_9PSEU
MSTDRAVEAFRAAHGRDPEGVFSAPGRVNLIGEHTDHNEGHVLPFAVDRRTYVAAARRDDDRVAVRSDDPGTEPVELAVADLASATGWSAYPVGTLWALGVGQGWDLVVHGEVPLGAGLSSSAALESAVALAVAELTGRDLDRVALAEAGRRAENEVVGAPVGIMDQAASLLCREGSALLLDCRSMATEDVALGFEEAGLAVLVIDSRVRHDLADGGYADRRAGCVAAAEALGVPALRDATLPAVENLPEGAPKKRARHVVTEQARVHEVVGLVRAGRPEEVGPVLSASHASLRDDYEVSVPEVDAIVDAAVGAGALGARIMGGGFGGSVIALVPSTRVGPVSEACRGLRPEPTVREVAPSAGARRDA